MHQPRFASQAAVYASNQSISLNELVKKAIALLVGGNEDLGDGLLVLKRMERVLYGKFYHNV